MSNKTLVLEGNNIHDIASFYEEINRVFMAEESWSLGSSLDALDDMLYGAYGAAQGDAPVVLVWNNIEKNRAELGVAATLAFYRDKLEHPERFNVAHIRRQYDALTRGAGPSFFDLVLEIFAAHPRIQIRPR